MSQSPLDTFTTHYEGIPPWEVNRPQPAIAEAASTGKIHGKVLDVGCGTGENSMMLASLGHEVLGIDFVDKAIETARQKAAQRKIPVTFLVADALALNTLGQRFDTLIDSGVFHVFNDDDRKRYVKSVASVLKSGGTLHLLCFSEKETREGGPRRVTMEEIRESFASFWHVEEVKETIYDATLHEGGSKARLITLKRIPPTDVMTAAD